MEIVEERKPIRWWAAGFYIVLWFIAVLLAILMFLGVALVSGFHLQWSGISFLLAVPAVLLGIRSFRQSSVAVIGLLLLDILISTWPHIELADFFSSLIDVLLLVTALLTGVLALLCPRGSILGIARQIRR